MLNETAPDDGDYQRQIDERIAQIPPCPKNKAKNLAFRAELRRLGDDDPLWAAAINEKNSRDVVFFVDTWGWTLNPKDFPQDPRQPIILFPRQEEYFRELDWCVENGEPLLVEKSREQLISVGTAIYCLWRWLYRANASIKIGSMKEELVDGDDFAGQIMPKIDYTLDELPSWIRPDGYEHAAPWRKYMTFKHPVSGRAIKGEATNKHFSVGGRYALVWLDEYPKIEEQDSIHRKVANTTNCYLYTGTPEGWERMAEMIASGQHRVFRLHWTDSGLWLPPGCELGKQCDWRNKVWPEEWMCKPGCKAHKLGGMPHSPRYDKECAKLDWNEQDIAQELDIEYHKSGAAVFDQDKLQRAAEWLRDNPQEYTHYSVDFVVPQGEQIVPGVNLDSWFEAAAKWRVVATETNGGPFRILKGREPFSCRNESCVCRGTGLHTYGLGGDTSRNVDKDFDCAWVIDYTLGDVIGEWHGRMQATQLGIEWAKICKWYGSSAGPRLMDAWGGVEWNELGLIVNETMAALGVYLHVSRTEDKIRKKRAPYLGVKVDPHNKVRLIQKYLVPQINESDPDCPDMPRLFVPFPRFISECRTFVYKASENLSTRPERAKPQAQTRKQHDDCVMAMMCGVYAGIERFGAVRGVTEQYDRATNLSRAA